MKGQTKLNNERQRKRKAAVQAGAYFWLRAEGQGEQLESALMRMAYYDALAELKAWQMDLPSERELYAAAVVRWPLERLHPGPKAKAEEVGA